MALAEKFFFQGLYSIHVWSARDNLDSKLTVEENLAIVDNILGQYLNEDK